MTIAVNDKVAYHGSLPEEHGTGQISLVPADPEGRGYVIVLDSGVVLHNVHRQSFTKVIDPDGFDNRPYPDPE